jgi:hypothetical protein
VAKAPSNSASSPTKKSAKQKAFEREAREKLENADMGKFDEMIRRILKPSQANPSHK